MITVNIFDALFSRQYSVLGKTPKEVKYVRDQMVFDGITLFTDAHIVQEAIVRNVVSPIKIGWLREPQCLHPTAYEAAWRNRHMFTKILTHYQPFLDQGEPFTFCPYGGIWIERSWWGVDNKTKNLSMLYGSKMATDGHRIRHTIAEYLIANLVPIDFYGYRGTPVDYSAETKRKVLKDYRFTIVTETCCQDNLFTEILLDCFAVGTVPIFWGCPNLGDYFNPDGVMQFEAVDEAVEWAANADEAAYHERIDAILNNYWSCIDYEVTEDWIYHNVFAEMQDAERL